MVMNVLFIVVFFFEMFISSIFFSGIVDKRRKLFIIIMFGILLFEIGALINVFLLSTVWLNVLFSFAANFIFSTLCFKIKARKAAFYSLLLVAISTLIEIITVFIISSFTQLYITNYKSETILLVIEIIISKIFYFVIAMFLLRFSQKDTTAVKLPIAFYVFPFITLVTAISFWYISLTQYIEFKNQIILGCISGLLFLATISVFFSFQSNAQKDHKLLMMQQEQDKMKTDITYYDILEQQNNNLRIYAHDAKNHLSAIKNLNTNPQIDAYISEMMACLTKYSNVCHSGNRVLDVIINKYVTECKLHQITFEFDIKNNNLSEIEQYDLMTILGNLLDNALEAAEQSTNKKVIIETEYRNDFTIIIVSNSCDKSPKMENSRLPVTTKENHRLHGFGLKSVKKAIKKYNGDLALEYDNTKKSIVVTVMIENTF